MHFLTVVLPPSPRTVWDYIHCIILNLFSGIFTHPLAISHIKFILDFSFLFNFVLLQLYPYPPPKCLCCCQTGTWRNMACQVEKSKGNPRQNFAWALLPFIRSNFPPVDKVAVHGRLAKCNGEPFCLHLYRNAVLHYAAKACVGVDYTAYLGSPLAEVCAISPCPSWLGR